MITLPPFIPYPRRLFCHFRPPPVVVKGHLFQGSFVLNQADRLAHYLNEDVKQKFGLGACNVIFNSTRMTGAFKMSKRGKDVIITEFEGTNHERHVIEAWCRQWRLSIEWELKSDDKVEV